jgi:hypothetical protein
MGNDLLCMILGLVRLNKLWRSSWVEMDVQLTGRLVSKWLESTQDEISWWFSWLQLALPRQRYLTYYLGNSLWFVTILRNCHMWGILGTHVISVCPSYLLVWPFFTPIATLPDHFYPLLSYFWESFLTSPPTVKLDVIYRPTTKYFSKSQIRVMRGPQVLTT